MLSSSRSVGVQLVKRRLVEAKEPSALRPTALGIVRLQPPNRILRPPAAFTTFEI